MNDVDEAARALIRRVHNDRARLIALLSDVDDLAKRALTALATAPDNIVPYMLEDGRHSAEALFEALFEIISAAAPECTDLTHEHEAPHEHL